MKNILIFLVCMMLFVWVSPQTQAQTAVTLPILPGDSWEVLAWRFQLPKERMLAQNSVINPYQNPTIGSTILLTDGGVEREGTAVYLNGQSLIMTALAYRLSPFALAEQNQIDSPFAPYFGALFVPLEHETVRLLPDGINRFGLSHIPAAPGEAVGWRAVGDANVTPQSWLNGRPLTVAQNGTTSLGLTGTGAFFGSGEPILAVLGENGRYWSQPWRFVDPDDWIYQQLTLTGSAAEIDQASIAAERERLFAIWEQASPEPLWQAPFQTPVVDFLAYSSPFGARRSYNGGPYRSYHEGVDFSAYGGTAVFAPAAGMIVVAEELYVRGGAVIIDHGLGIYTGFYHLSAVETAVGQPVAAGDKIGEVGTTGLSTGNHLHWDLLVNGVWVDANAWQRDQMGQWILAGWLGEW